MTLSTRYVLVLVAEKEFMMVLLEDIDFIIEIGEGIKRHAIKRGMEAGVLNAYERAIAVYRGNSSGVDSFIDIVAELDPIAPTPGRRVQEVQAAYAEGLSVSDIAIKVLGSRSDKNASEVRSTLRWLVSRPIVDDYSIPESSNAADLLHTGSIGGVGDPEVSNDLYAVHLGDFSILSADNPKGYIHYTYAIEPFGTPIYYGEGSNGRLESHFARAAKGSARTKTERAIDSAVQKVWEAGLVPIGRILGYYPQETLAFRAEEMAMMRALDTGLDIVNDALGSGVSVQQYKRAMQQFPELRDVPLESRLVAVKEKVLYVA